MTVLQLNAEQAARLHQLKLERDIARLSRALASAFPDVPARVGERYPQLIRHGLERATHHGLTHALCVARYLACWFALGAEFETRPAHGWAQDILGDLRRAQGAKAFQLCRRSSETLARLSAAAAAGPGAGAMSVAAFDQAVAALDAALADAGLVGSLIASGRVQLGEACDVDALDVRIAEPWVLQRYRLHEGVWRLMPVAAERAAVTIAAPAADAASPEGLPPVLYHLGPGDQRSVARLRVRTRAEHCCDFEVHPCVVYQGPREIKEWRGRLAGDLHIQLPADPGQPPAGDAPQPVIAAETAPQFGTLSIESCGLRSSGVPLGNVSTKVAVVPSDQFLMQWQREPGTPHAWPGAPAEPVVAPARVHVERDGVSWEATRWRLGLEALDRELLRGLGRLAVAWERESGVTQGRLQAQPQVLSGHATLTWGWAEGAPGLRCPPFFRTAGALDLMACQLDLQLSGNLQLDSSASRLTLQCVAAERLQASWDRHAADAADVQAHVAAAQVQFQQPFVLGVESIAWDGLGVATVAAPLSGALVGACGLRPGADGNGWQWFAQLRVEPVQAVLHIHDPVLGERELLRPLLPAMTLLDWSLG
jgi:hypothetical protein